VVLVVSPLRALMSEQVARLNRLAAASGHAPVATWFDTARNDDQRRQLSGQFALVYITPEKLFNLAQPGGPRVSSSDVPSSAWPPDSCSRDVLVGMFRAGLVRLVAVDEAHKIVSWGDDGFRTIYVHIGDILSDLAAEAAVRRPPVLALSASATSETRSRIVGSLYLRCEPGAGGAAAQGGPEMMFRCHCGCFVHPNSRKCYRCEEQLYLAGSSPPLPAPLSAGRFRVGRAWRDNLTVRVRERGTEIEEVEALCDEIGIGADAPTAAAVQPGVGTGGADGGPVLDAASAHGVQGLRLPAIVYCLTKNTVKSVKAKLDKQLTSRAPALAGRVAMLWGGDKNLDLDSILDRFFSGQVLILICTKAFGMGVSPPGVKLIYHMSIPEDMDDYFQQIGRAGRDGSGAACVLSASAGDVALHARPSSNGQAFDESAAPAARLAQAHAARLAQARAQKGREEKRGVKGHQQAGVRRRVMRVCEEEGLVAGGSPLSTAPLLAQRRQGAA
jgi:superfamily II DNA helicase RecQ